MTIRTIKGSNGSEVSIIEGVGDGSTKTSFSLGISVADARMLRPADLYDQKIMQEIRQTDYHLYMIVRQPRILYSRIEREKKEPNRVVILLSCHNYSECKCNPLCPDQSCDKYKELEVKLEFDLGGIRDVKMSNCKSKCTFVGASAEETINAYSLWNFHLRKSENTEDDIGLEVLYVGETKGHANDRLVHHDKLLEILASNAIQSPHQEIFLIFWNLNRQLMLSGDPENPNLKKEWDTLAKKYHSIDTEKIIELVEGCLINYFGPAYNSQLKDTFPKPTHESVKESVNKGLYSTFVFIEHVPYLYTERAGRKTEHEMFYGFKKVSELDDFFFATHLNKG